MNRYSNYKNYIESSCSCMKCVKPVQKVVSYDAIQNQRNIIFKNCQRMTQTVYKINMKLMKNQINVIIYPKILFLNNELLDWCDNFFAATRTFSLF